MIGARSRDRFVRGAGFTYLGVLLLVALLSLGAAKAVEIFQLAGQRDRERELIFVGRQYSDAIESFRKRSGNAIQPYPTRLIQLLRDPRFPGIVRHLRKLYPDPMTGKPEWGLARSARGGIVGVYSLSLEAPIKRANFPEGINFGRAPSYRGWVFLATGAASEPREDPLRASTAPVIEPVQPPEPPAPAAPVPPPTTAPRRPASILDDLRKHTPEGCGRIRAGDLAICAQSEVRFGGQAGADCRNSAAVRYSMCLATDSGPLQPLYFPRS